MPFDAIAHEVAVKFVKTALRAPPEQNCSATARTRPISETPSKRGGQSFHETQENDAPAQPIAAQSMNGTLSTAGGDGLGAAQIGTEPAPISERGDRIDRVTSDAHPSAVDPVIITLWRQRQDLRRAQSRLDLQCQAVVRRYSQGDKVRAAKRWAAIKAGGQDELEIVLTPYRMAMDPLGVASRGAERELERRARKLPLWTEWAKDVRGLGELSLAGLIGEAGRGLSEYRSVSALWKRMGLAVIGSERQRRVAGDAALEHGYSPQRRAFAYVLSTNPMRSQRDGDPYRAIYDRRKAYELERGIPKAHAHNRALRVMVKALLKDAWVADRRLRGFTDDVRCPTPKEPDHPPPERAVIGEDRPRVDLAEEVDSRL